LRKSRSAGPVSVSLALWFLFGLLLSAWFAFPMLRCFCVFRAFGEIKRDEMIPPWRKKKYTIVLVVLSVSLSFCVFSGLVSESMSGSDVDMGIVGVRMGVSK
jgi:hypothetical protein